MMGRDFEIWVQRKEALDRSIDEAIEWAERDHAAHRAARDSFENGQVEACIQSLRALRHFGGAAYEFFDFGFREGDLQHSDKYHSRYVFRTLLDHMSVDLNLLQKALFQRRRAGEGNQTEQARTLHLADSLALNALKPALESGFFIASAAVTHLAREFDIRLIPYYDLVLIGIPYTTYRVGSTPSESPNKDGDEPTLDYLAIPHEVGHYLYERGKVPGANGYVDQVLLKEILSKTGLNKGEWPFSWLEELFSDAYGCLIAGPVNVFSFQELLKDKPHAELRHDTGEHPIPILRPLVQTQILRKITVNEKPIFTEVSERLDEVWRQWVGDGDVLADSYELQGVVKTGQEIVDVLGKITDVIFETLKQLMPRDASAIWTGDLQSGEGLSELTRQFARREYPVQEQGYYRFKARLAEFNARSPKVDDFIHLVLFEDWETEHGLGGGDR